MTLIPLYLTLWRWVSFVFSCFRCIGHNLLRLIILIEERTESICCGWEGKVPRSCEMVWFFELELILGGHCRVWNCFLCTVIRWDWTEIYYWEAKCNRLAGSEYSSQAILVKSWSRLIWMICSFWQAYLSWLIFFSELEEKGPCLAPDHRETLKI